MLWSYEDEEMNVTGNSSDIKYDAEVMSDFTDALCHDMNSYRERARALERGYVKYHNNETFVGEMADVSKNFIYEVQGDMLHNRNLELKKEFLNMCLSIENMFKEEVDPSPKARVSVETLSNIKKDYNVCANVIDTKGYELDCHAKELVDTLGKWGISTVPNYRRPMEAFDEFCGHGRFLDKSIKKLENFDQEACALIDRMDVKGGANDLQRNIIHKAGILDSMTVYQPNMAKNSIKLTAIGGSAALSSISFPPELFAANSIKLVSPRDTTKKPRWWSLVKKKFSIDIVRSNAAVNNAKYIESMKEIYGFSQEEAELLNEAYLKHCENSEGIEKMSNRERANSFYTALTCLHGSYSANALEFKLMGGNKLSPKDAIAYFNSIGVDGEKLYDTVNNQHSSCEDNKKRDFVHECAIYSVMANTNAVTVGTSMDDDVGALIGYKGDVYSARMGIDDIRSDIAGYNIYYRMKRCEDGDVWNAMVEYNIDTCEGSINESKEFLQNLGYGNADLGMSVLSHKLYYNTAASETIRKMANADLMSVAIKKEEFLDYVSAESDIAHN